MAAVNLFLIVCSILAIQHIAALPSDSSRIINGTVAVHGNTHHQVSIRMDILESIDGSFGKGHICGGSLITPNVVLTAAHCFWDDDLEMFFDYSIYSVVMGQMDRFVKTEHTVQIPAAEIIYNNFERPTFKNDIALMVLESKMPVSTNPMIDVIAINREPIPVGTFCQVTGWGQTETGQLASSLMTVDLPIIDHDECSFSSSYEKGFIQEGMICAGYMAGEKDACQGDSGGPMVLNGKQVGVISFGDGCGLPGFPGVYTNVSYYADWIGKIIANETLMLTASDMKKKLEVGNSASMAALSSVVFLLGGLVLSYF